MSISSVSTFLFNDNSRTDLAKLQKQLLDLQGQVSSGHKAQDLTGYGASAAQLLSAKGLISQTQTYSDTATSLSARFDTIDTTLGSTYDAGEQLRQAVLKAVGNGDGTYLNQALSDAFNAARTALNTTYQGEALYGGERAGGTPINVSSLAALAAAPSTASIFDESSRPKTVDLGDGAFSVGPTASDVGSGLFDAMRTLQQTITAAGGSLGNPLTSAQITALQGVAASLSTADQTLSVAQGLNGELSNQVAAKATALSDRSTALQKTLGDVADADLADVATRLNAVQVQYQAVAQTYSQLSHLSLLDYLTTTT